MKTGFWRDIAKTYALNRLFKAASGTKSFELIRSKKILQTNWMEITEGDFLQSIAKSDVKRHPNIQD